MIRTAIPMFNLKTGELDFELIVYGISFLSNAKEAEQWSVDRRSKQCFPNHVPAFSGAYQIIDKPSIRTSGRRFK